MSNNETSEYVQLNATTNCKMKRNEKKGRRKFRLHDERMPCFQFILLLDSFIRT